MLRTIATRFNFYRSATLQLNHVQRTCQCRSSLQASVRFCTQVDEGLLFDTDQTSLSKSRKKMLKVMKKKTIVEDKDSHIALEVDENNDPDTFGTIVDEVEQRHLISTSEKLQQMKLEDDDEDNAHLRLSQVGRKRTPISYGREIQSLTRAGKVYEAIDVINTKMLKEDRVMPSVFVFSSLIGALGRVGYTREAFRMFNKMKKMGIEPDGPTYTGLFNACANSPFKEEGLKRAKKLHRQLKEKEVEMNSKTYNALIKAYGMCGDIVLAFSVMDEMKAERVQTTSQTYASLLITCISDKEAGFKHAIEVWRRYRKTKTGKFNTELYNLLLRAARDCGVGDIEFAQTLLKQNSKQDQLKLDSGVTLLRVAVVQPEGVVHRGAFERSNTVLICRPPLPPAPLRWTGRR